MSTYTIVQATKRDVRQFPAKNTSCGVRLRTVKSRPHPCGNVSEVVSLAVFPHLAGDGTLLLDVGKRIENVALEPIQALEHELQVRLPREVGGFGMCRAVAILQRSVDQITPLVRAADRIRPQGKALRWPGRGDGLPSMLD